MVEYCEIVNENKLYYIFPSFSTNKVISIMNNSTDENDILLLSPFNDSFIQAFYLYNTNDDCFYILNINSLKVLGVEETLDESFVNQNFIQSKDNYKWKIIKASNRNEFYIELFNSKKRLEIKNDYAIINKKYENEISQKFKFKECFYNLSKSDIWIKCEKFICRKSIKNGLYIILSAENENKVLNYDYKKESLISSEFNGNIEQLFYITLNKNGSYYLDNYKKLKTKIKNNSNGYTEFQINKICLDQYENPLFCISLMTHNTKLNLEILNEGSLKYKKENKKKSQQFYLCLLDEELIFDKYIRENLIKEKSGLSIHIRNDLLYLYSYSIDYYRNIINLSIDNEIKIIDKDILKRIKTLRNIKVHPNMLDKFNKGNIIKILKNYIYLQI